MDADGEITDCGMNSPFVHLRCFIPDLSTSRNGAAGSEQIREGALNQNMLSGLFLFITDVPVKQRILESR